MENNLIYDYCTKEKVAIRFETEDQLNNLHSLFNRMKNTIYLWKNGGWVTYTIVKRAGFTSPMLISPVPPDEYILLTADEFFTLALPDRSILESIK